ncbi:hypothetical protein DV735_g3465, partial [Chaetothyriales sp. CBS 134920]
MSKTQEAAHRFFASPQFAVVGASQAQAKFGYRILAWYHTHSLPVTPINPTRPTISLPSHTYPTVASVRELAAPADTALSFITPPPATLETLKAAKEVGVKSVWLQPGSFDDGVLAYAQRNFENAVAGFDEGTVGENGND